MKQRILVLSSLIVVLGTTLSFGAIAQNPNINPPIAGKKQRREHHPELVRALRALENAKRDLIHADRDFGGHRAKAQQLTEQAIQEVHEAMKADRN